MAKALKMVSEATLRRLPAYLQVLKQLRNGGRDVVSCPHLGRELKLDPTQIRKDLAATGITGRAKVGYEVNQLMESIETFLGWKRGNEAFLVGVGNLGRALLGYPGFSENGLNIVAAFDTDPGLVDTEVCGRSVLAVEKLVDLCHRMHVSIGIIAVPAESAQDIADRMVLGGITGIWNFTPAVLNIPGDIIVENVQLTTSLAVLTSKLRLASGSCG